MSLLLTPEFAGVDEAGRGALAGPLFVAAVVLPASFDISGLNDSKKLSAAARQVQASRILDTAQYCIVEVSLESIESLNILGATMKGMSQALAGLALLPPKALIDGNRCPHNAPCPCEAVIGGDAKLAAIAAASILAKTARDACMKTYATQYPEYGFDRHMGYGTAEHLAVLRAHGPCPIHRMSFAPMKNTTTQPCLEFAG